MYFKKFLTGVCAITIITTMGITTFGATTTETTSTTISENVVRKEKPALTEEQKAEMELKKAKLDEIQNKWANLTDAQKEEIYALKDKASDIEMQIIDKYVQWGIIDSETANEIKTKFAERKIQMRENGGMPMLGGKGGHRKPPIKDAE